jgi:energy-converting hydrogenase Eha subunit E
MHTLSATTTGPSNLAGRPWPGADRIRGSRSTEGTDLVFLFFSSRLGCLGSLAVSVIVTLILLAVFGVL